MNQMKYYFDAKKISGSQANKELFVKEIFQFLMQRTTIATNQTKSPQTEIFDAIWANVALRGNIWNDIPTPITQAVIDNYRGKFAIIVADQTNSFFNFIKVK